MKVNELPKFKVMKSRYCKVFKNEFFKKVLESTHTEKSRPQNLNYKFLIFKPAATNNN
jgi:hypothetical protein